MSEIEFVVGEQDIVDFNEYHFATSPTVKSQLLRYQIGWVAVFGPLALFSVMMRGFSLVMIFLILSAVILPLAYRTIVTRSHRKTVLKLIREGNNPGMLGKQLLRADAEGLYNSSEQGEQRVNWNSIERTVRTDCHEFIYLGAFVAIVIPRAGVTEGNLEQFMAEVRRRVTEAA